MRLVVLIASLLALGCVATTHGGASSKLYSSYPQLSQNKESSFVSEVPPPPVQGAGTLGLASSFFLEVPSAVGRELDFLFVPSMSEELRPFNSSGLSPPTFS